MKDRLLALEEAMEGTRATARELALLRGLARKHGFDTRTGVPKRITRDVTEADKPKILAANAAVSTFLWLQHARDAVCVELDLTPEQVAGVLAEATRKANEAAAAPASVVPTPPAAKPRASLPPAPTAARPIDYTNPANWPSARPVTNGGKAGAPPKAGHGEYAYDEDDRRVVLAARAQIADDVIGLPAMVDGAYATWDAFRRAYGAHRRLTTQQIAGIVAVHSRTPRPEAQA